jgi:hypothetical protein
MGSDAEEGWAVGKHDTRGPSMGAVLFLIKFGLDSYYEESGMNPLRIW